MTPQIDLIKEKSLKSQKARKNKKCRNETVEICDKVIKSSEGVSIMRLAIVGWLILADIAIFVVLFIWLFTIFSWTLIATYLIGIIFAWRVAISDKNSDSKVSWIMFLLILAPAGIVFYFMAGETTKKRRKGRRLRKIVERTQLLHKADIPDNLPSRVKQDCNLIQNTSNFPPYFCTTSKYFSTGEDFYEDVLTELQRAEKFVFMDFFIFSEGYLADAIIKILADKTKTGVEVKIVVDGFGSHDILRRSNIKKLKRLGIQLVAFESLLQRLNFLMVYRNHRKIIVIDGKVGYAGGANLGDEYINAEQRFGLWKDAALRIDGQAVKSLTLMFMRMWDFASKEQSEYEKYLSASDNIGENDSDGVIVPYGDGVSEKHNIGKSVYCNIINNAKDYIYIMSPYFIIDNSVIKLLKAKARSGVDVRLLLPGIPDKKLIYKLTYANAEKLLDSGIKVYIYSPGFLHSKVVLSDDECAVVGSINFDFRSFYQQYENAVYIGGGEVIKDISADFRKAFAESGLLDYIKKRNIFSRTALSFVRLFSPLM